MAPRMGAPSVSKPPEAATITPIELACLVQQYLMENRFPKALQEFQTEAGHLLSTVRTPKSMRSLTVILSEYINLKTFEAQAAAEKARTDQLLRNLYGVLEDFRPGSIKDYVAGQSTDPDRRGLSQQSLGKENVRQQRGKKSRKSGASNGGPPMFLAPVPHPSSHPPTFLQNGSMWPQPGQGRYVLSPPLNPAPSSSPGVPGSSPSPLGLFQPPTNVQTPPENGSGRSPGGIFGAHNDPAMTTSSAQPAPTFIPLHHSPGTSQPAPTQAAYPGAVPFQEQPAMPFSAAQASGNLGGSPTTHPVNKPLQLEGTHGGPQQAQQSTVAEPSASHPQGPELNIDEAGQPLPSSQVPEAGRSSPAYEQPAGESGVGMSAGQTWPSLESPRPGLLDSIQQRNSSKDGGTTVRPETVDLSTPPKAPKGGGARAAARAKASPLKSPHAGRKGTPRKRKMDGQGAAPAPKRASPSRALFGGQPAGAPEKQPKKALFTDDPVKSSQSAEGDGSKDGRESDAGLLDHLELPGEEPMAEADFRALVVDTFSKDLDLPSRIAGHITQFLHGGGQGAGDGDPLGGLEIPGDASDWGGGDGVGLGDGFFTDDDIPVDDILAAITADPHVSQLLDSLAATPVSLSGFDDFIANDKS
ncbi:hypothetical protein KFL_000500030 [Klebsormidium nitens]|uniref:Uncharacterized protein n=1 Tax=Klebsormidium nitens TaxID=105231 RepID=A0A1Y1HTB8_KLENI|nr:hypothetical protein KFL_000500030 [Klebsormidium nitens]|eukprot:GAQ80251.1 hypothetical protein KFL_000500030 [Klebsormidium nitens]